MSLIEIIVVMGVFLILIATIRFFPIDFFYARSLEDDAAKIAFALRGAHDRSVTQDSASAWGVHFVNATSGADYYQVFKGNTFETGTAVEQINLNETVQFSMPPAASSTDVLFVKMTGMPTGVGSIVISSVAKPELSKTITILGSGQINY